MNYNHIDQL